MYTLCYLSDAENTPFMLVSYLLRLVDVRRCMVFMILNLFYRGQQSYTSEGSFRQGYTVGEDEDDFVGLIAPIQNGLGQISKGHLEMRDTMVPL